MGQTTKEGLAAPALRQELLRQLRPLADQPGLHAPGMAEIRGLVQALVGDLENWTTCHLQLRGELLERVEQLADGQICLRALADGLRSLVQRLSAADVSKLPAPSAAFLTDYRDGFTQDLEHVEPLARAQPEELLEARCKWDEAIAQLRSDLAALLIVLQEEWIELLEDEGDDAPEDED